jgi:predicted  nucleic acid-binding Zn-ribbon protein
VTMIGRVEAIYKLQLTDSEIDEKSETLRALEDQLESDQELRAARQAVDREEEALRDARATLRDMELELEQLASKVSSTAQALYGGEVTNPKELAGIEQELEYLRRRQSALEDDALSVMAKVEDRAEKLSRAEEHLAHVGKVHEAAQADLNEEAQELRQRLDSLAEEREAIAEEISGNDLATYEGLRAQRRGQAVALLENGVCQGCRVALPTSLAQRVRRGTDLVQCGSCQRILYAAR